MLSSVLLLPSHFSRVWLCATPETAAHQAPLSLGFSRQEHWSGLPFPSPMHESEVAQSCPTLCDPMDCSPPGSSIHGIFQARILEWGAIAFSEGCHCLLWLSSLDGYNWKDKKQNKKFCDRRWNFSKWLASIFEPNPLLLLECSMSLAHWLSPYCRDETKGLIWYTQTLIRVSIVKGIHHSTLLFTIGLLTFYSKWKPGPGSCNFLMNLSL